jgi:hypothetical protein
MSQSVSKKNISGLRLDRSVYQCCSHIRILKTSAQCLSYLVHITKWNIYRTFLSYALYKTSSQNTRLKALENLCMLTVCLIMVFHQSLFLSAS